ncbi:glycerophosphodiester phosphodiesterase [Corynebacterium mendelii]|uniref:Glycerophosphodiester phosphodiesterase n=1 Tax=Corynebacterium mendelii TaxID=2765362 RepID=A0A939E3Y6_9CORY|nr:glycerophosphodiester phosphodiesterase family protein [Corynebacterium mendelii]MBN9645318.1 glycerophosphodiester phosphodiesterase [Corynebacterium mendelii]
MARSSMTWPDDTVAGRISEGTKIIGHRGSAGTCPENTELSFTTALQAGAHAIECDVRLTRCGTPVVIHDPTIDRVSDGWGRVSNLTLDELRDYNFGTRDHPQTVMTLDELLDFIGDWQGRRLFVETKHPGRFGGLLEERVADELARHKMINNDKVVVISFSSVSLARMNRLAPGNPRFFLRRDWYPNSFRVPFSVVGPTGVGLSLEAARRNPVLLPMLRKPRYMWTFKNMPTMEWAVARGIDWIATDYPGKAATIDGVAKL